MSTYNNQTSPYGNQYVCGQSHTYCNLRLITLCCKTLPYVVRHYTIRCKMSWSACVCVWRHVRAITCMLIILRNLNNSLLFMTQSQVCLVLVLVLIANWDMETIRYYSLVPLFMLLFERQKKATCVYIALCIHCNNMLIVETLNNTVILQILFYQVNLNQQPRINLPVIFLHMQFKHYFKLYSKLTISQTSNYHFA